MKITPARQIVLIFIVSIFSACSQAPVENKNETIEISDPLPSWNDGDVKKSMIGYVESVTDSANPDFIPVAERIAVFDNDGTMWCEQPMYFQLIFTLDRIKEISAEHPEWVDTPPYSYVLNDDIHGVLDSGMEGLMTLLMASHAGNNTQEFKSIVMDWLSKAEHSRFNKPYNELVYQPMIEFVYYLQDNDFKTYIVSGGGVEFMRPIISKIYRIPYEQIIGSTIKTEYVYDNGNPKIIRLPEIDFIDDKEGKPVNINKIIGKKPVIAGGNSDGDLAMLQWTASNKYKSLCIYVHHTDSVREWAYDRDSHIGRLDKGLDQAINDGWVVADMSNDWKMVFPFESKD
jgi:hypothetical protein